MGKIVGGRVYVDDNKDRFGQPIRPLKPIDMKPGPGTYFVEDEGGANNLVDKCFPIEEAKSFPQAERDTNKVKRGVPGPAYYKPALEPKKISFLFNPAEKWAS